MAKLSALFLLALLTISMFHTHAAGPVKLPTWAPKWLERAPKWVKRAQDLLDIILKEKDPPPTLSPETLKTIQCPLLCSKWCSKSPYPTKCNGLCLNCCKKCRNSGQPCKC